MSSSGSIAAMALMAMAVLSTQMSAPGKIQFAAILAMRRWASYREGRGGLGLKAKENDGKLGR